METVTKQLQELPQLELPQPEQQQPEQPELEQIQPEQPQPEQTQPEQTQPEQTQPEQTNPEQPNPKQPNPKQPKSEKPQLEQPQPERPQHQEQPQSLPSWRTYNGPKLYVKPKVRISNFQLIHKAVSKALEGAADANTLKKIKDSIDASLSGHFLILFRNNKFKGLYDYNNKEETISKLDGIGPKTVNLDDIVRFYKYDLSKRQFVQVETKHIGPTIIGFSLANLRPKQ